MSLNLKQDDLGTFGHGLGGSFLPNDSYNFLSPC